MIYNFYSLIRIMYNITKTCFLCFDFPLQCVALCHLGAALGGALGRLWSMVEHGGARWPKGRVSPGFTGADT